MQQTKELTLNIRKIALIVSLLAVLLAGTVLSAGAATPMYVGAFHVTYVAPHTHAVVRVIDALKHPIAGALVTIAFSQPGRLPIVRSHITGLHGGTTVSATLTAGKWLVCVQSITKAGYVYSPAKKLCTVFAVP